MNGKQHLVSGAATAVLAYSGLRAMESLPALEPAARFVLDSVSSLPWYGMAAAVGLYGFGQLLPDIDHERNSLGVYVPIEQRTWLHSIYMILALAVPSVLTPIFTFLMLGYFVHVFWDSFSKCGIAWFKPWNGYRKYPSGAKVKKGFHIVLYRGDVSAWVLCAVLCVLAVASLIYVTLYV